MTGLTVGESAVDNEHGIGRLHIVGTLTPASDPRDPGFWTSLCGHVVDAACDHSVPARHLSPDSPASASNTACFECTLLSITLTKINPMVPAVPDLAVKPGQ